jgi:superoxide reductase
MFVTGQDLFAGVNKPVDPFNLTDLEKKHMPVITAPDEVRAGEPFEVTVEVGELLPHPNEQDHFIGFIDLYVGHRYVARLSLTAGMVSPVLKARLRLARDAAGPLRAFSACNLHGTWESTRDVRVI